MTVVRVPLQNGRQDAQSGSLNDPVIFQETFTPIPANTLRQSALSILQTLQELPMAQDLSIEHPDFVFFSTIRTMNSRLWFVGTPELQDRIQAFLARYQEMYGVVIYGFIIMGNHYHLIAKFPLMNKAAFFKAFNSMIARLTNTAVEQFEGGKLWARPVRSQPIGDELDIKDRFFYAALNPVGAGLVRKLSEYKSYNSFNDAITGKKRKFKIFHREDYNNRKRSNSKLTHAECTSEHTLTYSRLPGYEQMSHADYVKVMSKELEVRRVFVVEQRLKDGRGFATAEALSKLRPGAKPKSTKTSTRHSKRPLILTRLFELRTKYLRWYFDLRERYQEASRRFRAGELSVAFPTGTYRPPSFCI